VANVTIALDAQLHFTNSALSRQELLDQVKSAIQYFICEDIGVMDGADLSSFSMDALSNPDSLIPAATARLVSEGNSDALAQAKAKYGLMSPTDFIEDLSGSQQLLEFVGYSLASGGAA
jgi:hypothetical protein